MPPAGPGAGAGSQAAAGALAGIAGAPSFFSTYKYQLLIGAGVLLLILVGVYLYVRRSGPPGGGKQGGGRALGPPGDPGPIVAPPPGSAPGGARAGVDPNATVQAANAAAMMQVREMRLQQAAGPAQALPAGAPPAPVGLGGVPAPAGAARVSFAPEQGAASRQAQSRVAGVGTGHVQAARMAPAAAEPAQADPDMDAFRASIESGVETEEGA